MCNKSGQILGLALFWALLALSPIRAHEYWIEPLDFSPPLHLETAAHLNVGSDLKGQNLSYIPQFTVGFQITDMNGRHELQGNAGDRPALTFTPEASGLNVITYQTTRNRVNFATWEKFETYLVTQGMQDVAARHRARGLPETDFSEAYSRFAKSLVAVGDDTTGNDRATGMLAELVALQNPYALSQGNELTIQMLYEGQPVADNQVSIFAKGDALEITRLRTDENGQISFTLAADTMYMLNAIKMVEAEITAIEVWESFWASLTFKSPE